MKELKLPEIEVNVGNIKKYLTQLVNHEPFDKIENQDYLKRKIPKFDVVIKDFKKLKLVENNKTLTAKVKILLDNSKNDLFYVNFKKYCLKEFPDFKLFNSLVDTLYFSNQNYICLVPNEVYKQLKNKEYSIEKNSYKFFFDLCEKCHKVKVQRENKELNIPYIGIKVQSIPSILEVAKKSKTDKEFMNHFMNIEKAEGTTREYLHSLRNLKLATRDDNGQTVVTNAGNNLILDDIEIFYKNLFDHCSKNFEGFKIIKNIIKEQKPKTVGQLNKMIEKEGYYIERTQTLTSYYKMFYDSKFIKEKKNINTDIKAGENLEYNQCTNLLFKMHKKYRQNNYTIQEFRKYIKFEIPDNVNFTEEIFTNYLKLMDRERIIKLYQITQGVLQDTTGTVIINNKYYYNFEVIKYGT